MVRFRIKPVEISDSDESSTGSNVGILRRIRLKKKSEKALLLEIAPQDKEKVFQRYKDTSLVVYEDSASGRWDTDDPFGFRDLKSSKVFVECKGNILQNKRLENPDLKLPKREQNLTKLIPNALIPSLPDSLNKDIEIQSHRQQPPSPKIFIQDSWTPVQSYKKEVQIQAVLLHEKIPNTLQPSRRKRRCIVS